MFLNFKLISWLKSHGCIFIWIWQIQPMKLDEPSALFIKRGNRGRISLSAETLDVCQKETVPRHVESSGGRLSAADAKVPHQKVATFGCCDVEHRSVAFFSHTLVLGAHPNCHASYLHNVPVLRLGEEEKNVLH